jgi:lysozyme
MQFSDRGLKLTETSEGLRLKSYQDTGGVWTIGYGHTVGVKPNQLITEETADSLLKLDIAYAVNVVNVHCNRCTQSQFDALVDFCFNVGPTQFLSSHLYSYHKAGAYDKAAAEFPKWKYDNGKVIQGLVTRRLAERALYSLQEPQEAHPHTDVQEHSVPSTVGSVSAIPGPNVVQSSPAQPLPASSAAPVSSNRQAVFESRFDALLRKLAKLAQQVREY